uniref:Carbohydrate binding module family 33 and 10 domain protein n=1 Tax=Teredinibacter turnerae (strain ATCC 39867 / T7901) TaxID=377629 RepID=UPI0012494B33|nr:Chain A, Carbohydrate binding module family 33 and 10 domain protein [Teredinibacter turnerae T7901]
HGYIESPPSRQQHCGAEQKPDNPSSAKCDEAFANYRAAGGQNSHWYNFMSVVAHHEGRKVVKGTEHVCGFDGETWNPAPYDTPANWPVTSFNSGQQTFVWDISYGPHFSDTEELVFYITKPGFSFDPTRELTWADFEDQPFCDESIVPGDFSTNSAVEADMANSHINVTCNVPSRSGRHVIFAEWGRNEHTYERFFSCVDVDFGWSHPNFEK